MFVEEYFFEVKKIFRNWSLIFSDEKWKNLIYQTTSPNVHYYNVKNSKPSRRLIHEGQVVEKDVAGVEEEIVPTIAAKEVEPPPFHFDHLKWRSNRRMSQN